MLDATTAALRPALIAFSRFILVPLMGRADEKIEECPERPTLFPPSTRLAGNCGEQKSLGESAL